MDFFELSQKQIENQQKDLLGIESELCELKNSFKVFLFYNIF